MPKTLPRAWDLITDSWRAYVKNWNETFKVSIWFLYFGLVTFAGAVLLKVSGSSAFVLTDAILGVIVAVGYIWAGIRLIQAVLDLEAGRKVSLDIKMSQKAGGLILSVLWVAVLQLAVIIGGFLLLIVPGIYLALALSFSQVMLIDGDQRGFAALAASRALVKGRWWATFWRLLAGNVVFGLVLGLLMSLLLGLLAAFSGTDAFVVQGTAAFKADPLVQGAYELLQSIMQASVLPLFIIFQVKLYKALKASR